MQSPLYSQILTGVLPYDGIDDYFAVTHHIRSGERPSRPTNEDVNQRLQDGVWDMITTCWREDPKKRWEVRAVHKLFSTPSLQEARNANSGNGNTRNAGNKSS